MPVRRHTDNPEPFQPLLGMSSIRARCPAYRPAKQGNRPNGERRDKADDDHIHEKGPEGVHVDVVSGRFHPPG
jgi:hypothetical protein